MSRTGSQKLAVFLCKFSDNANVEPHPPDFYKELIALRGTGGLNDYWIAASLGAINLDGTDIFGWRTIDQTQAAFLAAHPARHDKIQGAMDAFPQVDTSKYAGVIAMFNTDVGDAGASGGVLASPSNMSVTFLAHETGHVFDLEHSFDQSDRKTDTWSAPGEYFDRFDIMSAMNVYTTTHPKFGRRGPLLCAPNLDRMGWLPASRVWSSHSSNSSWSDEFDLVSLSHPGIPGYLAARLGSLYLEFRTPDLWDAGTPHPGVLIHQMFDPNAIVLASDRARYINDWQPGQVYGASDIELTIEGGTQIRIISFDLHAKKARIGIRVAARRRWVAGPGQIFGGVASDGGGIIIINGRVIRIPPYDPLFVLAEAMAARLTADSSIGALASGLGLGRFNQR